MSWHTIDVDGRVMYESSNGERVLDPSNIPTGRPYRRERTIYHHADWKWRAYFWLCAFMLAALANFLH